MGHSDQGDEPVPSRAASDGAQDSTQDGARQHSERGVKAPNESADSAPDAERRKKINELQQAVSDGTYHVSSEEVARKIIEHMLEPKG